MDKILLLRFKRTVITALLSASMTLFIFIKSLYSDIDVSIGYSYSKNVPYLYDPLLIPQYIDLLSNRVVMRDISEYYISLRFEYDTFLFSLYAPYIKIIGEKTNTGPGDIKLKIGQKIVDLNFISLSLLLGMEFSITNGQEKYLSEWNTSSGNINIFGGIEAVFSIFPNDRLILSFELNKLGKMTTEKKYDTFNRFSYGKLFRVKIVNKLKIEILFFELIWKLNISLDYKEENFDRIDRKNIPNSRTILSKFGTSFEVYPIKNFGLYTKLNFSKYIYPLLPDIFSQFDIGIILNI